MNWKTELQVRDLEPGQRLEMAVDDRNRTRLVAEQFEQTPNPAGREKGTIATRDEGGIDAVFECM